jgi:thioredoxin 1
MEISAVTDTNFDSEVLRSDLPVLVDFGAAWCHPCKQLDPIVEELAEEWRGRVKVATLDIDSNVQTTVKYGVMGVPTLILFIQGQPKERLSGFQPKARIIERLTPHLSG